MEDKGWNNLGFDFKEESTQMGSDNACGCPASKMTEEETNKMEETKDGFLNSGKGTDVEKDAINAAKDLFNLIESFCKLGVALILIFCVILFGLSAGYGQVAAGFVTTIPYVIAAVILYFGSKFSAKLCRALIMLLVNISITLKRIEIKQEQGETK